MKTKLIAATVVALAAMSGASAFAATRSGNAGVYIPTPFDTTSTVTRAQVQEDTMQARQQGTFDLDSDSASIRSADTVAAKPAAMSTVSRSEVRAQTSQWAQSHQANSDSDRKLSSQ
jgi:Domain of unknown function (DUF4148)